MNIQYSNDENQNQEFNQAKIEYDRITSFHEKLGRNLIWAIGLIFTIFGILFYSSFKDIKEDAEKKVDKVIAETKEAQAKSDKDLQDVKIDAKEILARNKEISDFQIQFLKEDVRNMALSSSRNRIDEILNSPNVQALVEQRTRKEVAEKLNEVVQEETAKTREVFDYLPQITIAYDQIRQGSRKYLDLLDSLSNYSNNIEIRSLAKKLLLQRGKEYENMLSLNVSEFYYDGPQSWVAPGEINDTLKSTLIRKLNISDNSTKDEIIKSIMSRFKTENGLYALTLYYIHLSKLLNYKFKIFDSKPVYDWYNKNYK